MEDPKTDHRQKVALFRYGLIADLLRPDPNSRKSIAARLKEKAEAEHEIPGTTRRIVAAETIRDWLKMYRRGGFEALLPKQRSDLGESRAIPKDIQDILLCLKDEHPNYSVPTLLTEARSTGLVPMELVLPPSTVHRLLAQHGYSAKATHSAGKDHRRFEFEFAGQLWMSDVMHGPAVGFEGKRKRKSYLAAFLDDASRVVPYAAFAFSENTAAFMPTLKQAIARRGLPERLFVDNGSAFRSQQLALTAAKLGITLIHARAYHPQAKGKIERFFRTLRSRWLARLKDAELASLEAINRSLWAFIEGEYHQTPHKGLGGETPLERWARTAADVRYPTAAEIEDHFLFEQKRRVKKDRTVSLDGVVYEVAADLVDLNVVLRYDPADRRTIRVVSRGKEVGIARPVDVRANCHVQRQTAPTLRLSELSDEELKEIF